MKPLVSAVLVACCVGFAASPLPPVTRTSIPAYFEPAAVKGKPSSGFEIHQRQWVATLHPGIARFQFGTGQAYQLTWDGASPNSSLEGDGRQPGYANYFIGPRDEWRTGVPQFSGVRNRQLYPGIDAVYSLQNGLLEYDLHLAPRVSPGVIRFHLDGASGARLTPAGDLVFRTGDLEVTHHRPQAYQLAGGSRKAVDASFQLTADGWIGFHVGAYDADLPLVIDPTLSFSGYVVVPSPNFGEYGNSLAVDGNGNVYLAGTVLTDQFGRSTAVVVKIDPTAAQAVYTTYLGPATGVAVAVDPNGQAYLTGSVTKTTGFPLVNALQTTLHVVGEAYVAKLDANGSILYSTYLGGSSGSTARDITADAAGNAYVAGETLSTNFPVANAYQASYGGNQDGFLTKLNPSGSAISFSTYFGGASCDSISAVALDPSGNIYLAGSLGSSSVGCSVNGAAPKAFAAKLQSNGVTLVYSNTLATASILPPGVNAGSSRGVGVTADASGNAYVAGTSLAQTIPLVSPFINRYNGYGNCFLVKLAAGGSVTFSTLVPADNCRGPVLDNTGNIAITGQRTGMEAFPWVDPVQTNTVSATQMGFVTLFDGAGAGILFSSPLGTTSGENDFNAVAADANGNLYVAGQAWASGYPSVNGLNSFLSPSSMVVSKINLATACSYQVAPTQDTQNYSTPAVTHNIAVTAPNGCVWNATSYGIVSILGPNTDANGTPLTANEPYFSGSGNGNVPYVVTYAGGPDRDASLIVAGKKVTIHVPGTGCAYQLSSTSTTIGLSGGVGSVILQTDPGCLYTTDTSDPWITVTSGGSGSGGTVVSFSAAATGIARSGVLYIAGLPFTVVQNSPVLTVTKTHLGNFSAGMNGAAYTVVVSNQVNRPASSGQVSLSEFAPQGLTVVSMSGNGWTCNIPTCTRSDALVGGSSYPPVTILVNVAANASTPAVNQVALSGGGSAPANALDSTTIVPAFTDVGSGDFDFNAINLMREFGITGGCSANPPMYCPNDNVTRAQMAIFIVRAVLGGDNFPYSPTPHFNDVPANAFGFQWIQKMYELSITAGCGNGNYCPNDQVTRGQMAIFVIRARLGAAADATFTYPAAPYFTDVPDSHPFFKWIQRMRLDLITGGCGNGSTYCPDDAVTRGQMAIFIMRGAFNLLLPAGTPVISPASPTILPLGQTTVVTLTGANTNFVQGTTQVSVPAGITVGTVTVNSATSLTVELTVAANAPTGPRSLVVATGAEQAVLPNGVIVQ